MNDLFNLSEAQFQSSRLKGVFELYFEKKAEKEYYSRTVKKKVVALANPELHRLAQKLMA